LNHSKLARIVGPTESVIFYDEKTGKLIRMVLRDFCSDEDVLKWFDAVIKEVVDYKKSIR
ncbi:hypothetical protein BKA93DRAFT_700359, partial [Sparassis latifolia]